MDAIRVPSAEIRADDKRGGFIGEPGQEQGSGNIAGDLRSQNCHQHFPPGEDGLQPARKGRDAPQIADENEECHKGQQQGVIHIAESGAVSAEGTDQHSGKGNAVGQYPDDRQQTDRKQHHIQQDDFRSAVVFGCSGSAPMQEDACLRQTATAQPTRSSSETTV